MNMITRTILLFLMIIITSLTVYGQTTVDRMIATVNGDAITESDIIWGLALVPEIGDDIYSKANRAQMLNQIIDQRLLLNEASRLPSLDPSSDEVRKSVVDLMKRFPDQTAFYQRLEKVGLSSQSLEEITRQRLRILKYIEFRFRAFAIISEEEIQQYYRSVVVPKITASGEKAPEQASGEVRTLIEANLVESKINHEIDQFLENAKNQADIILLTDF